jgi:hypothetical protein
MADAPRPGLGTPFYEDDLYRVYQGKTPTGLDVDLNMPVRPAQGMLERMVMGKTGDGGHSELILSGPPQHLGHLAPSAGFGAAVGGLAGLTGALLAGGKRVGLTGSIGAGAGALLGLINPFDVIHQNQVLPNDEAVARYLATASPQAKTSSAIQYGETVPYGQGRAVSFYPDGEQTEVEFGRRGNFGEIAAFGGIGAGLGALSGTAGSVIADVINRKPIRPRSIAPWAGAAALVGAGIFADAAARPNSILAEDRTMSNDEALTLMEQIRQANAASDQARAALGIPMGY